jgi:hypothetical protein
MFTPTRNGLEVHSAKSRTLFASEADGGCSIGTVEQPADVEAARAALGALPSSERARLFRACRELKAASYV